MNDKERLEEGLYALLLMAWASSQDLMADTITDLLHGFELKESYKVVAIEGKRQFNESYNS